MRINLKNQEKVTAALDKVNGQAREHTFDYSDLCAAVLEAEESRIHQILPRKNWKGMRLALRSGRPVARAYKRERIATRVVLERGARAWFMVDISRARIIPQEGGESWLWLTEEQRDIVLAKVCRSPRGSVD